MTGIAEHTLQRALAFLRQERDAPIITSFRLAQGFRRDTGRVRDFRQVASRSRVTQGAETPAGFDLPRCERLADHAPRRGLVLLYR